jgi:DNA recombination protein RmuC
MVREHVKELGSAYYWSSYDTLPDCVIMFLPTEGAYFAALEADPTLLQEAKDSGVYLANPMTVLNMAHIAAYVLADERVRQNAQEIKNLGSELYERLRMFGEHFTNVGQNLRQSVDSYNKALSWIDRNVMPTARKMQLLGTAKGKVLQPPNHIDKNVSRVQSPDLRELPVELTYEEEPEPGEA